MSQSRVKTLKQRIATLSGDKERMAQRIRDAKKQSEAAIRVSRIFLIGTASVMLLSGAPKRAHAQD